MIVRIFSEGQYRIPDDARAELQELDQACVAAVDAGDEAAFTATFAALLEHVRGSGEKLADDALEPSDLMLPPADISLEEARSEFTGDGLIPD
jgi:hypothetical protein